MRVRCSGDGRTPLPSRDGYREHWRCSSICLFWRHRGSKLNPDSRFVGVDLSEPMLARARDNLARERLANIELRHGDISNLINVPDHSASVVISTMALHHLPTLRHLQATFAEIARILKPNGGLYLVDFGHLKSER